MPGCTAGWDNANYFVRSLFPIRMNHDNYNNILDRSNGMPSLLSIADPLDKRNAVRIFEDKLGSFEIDAMFFPGAPILGFIPFKSNHVYLHSRKYIADCQETVSP